MASLVDLWLKKIYLTMQKTEVHSFGREYSPGEGNGNSLQYSYLGNPMVRGAWWATVQGTAKKLDSTYQLNNEKAMCYVWGDFMEFFSVHTPKSQLLTYQTIQNSSVEVMLDIGYWDFSSGPVVKNQESVLWLQEAGF